MTTRLQIVFVSLLAALTLGACAQNKKSVQQDPNPGNTYAGTPAGMLGYESITMSRTPCFGRCPVYTLQVFPDGRAVYNGKRNVEHTGVYEKQIGPAGTQPIFDGFARYRADTCAGKYNVNVSDLPGLNFILRINGRDQRISNANFGPKFLDELGRLMDEQVKVDAGWTKTGDGTEER